MKKALIIVVSFFTFFCSYTYAQTCINPPDSVYVTITTAHCSNSDGSIVIDSVRNGTAPFTYSLNAGAAQTSNIFNNLAQGSYNLTVSDDSGCVYNYPVSINVPKTYSPQPSTTTITSVSVCNANDGSIKVTNTGAGSPFSYTLNGGAAQASNTFSNLIAGTYTVKVTDAFGCDTSVSVFVPQPGGITAAGATPTAADCGTTNGSITTQVFTGTAAVLDSITGRPSQASPTFTNVATGLYDAVLTDANGCKFTIFNVFVPQNSGPTDITVTTVVENCDHLDGEIHISNPVGGVSPYTYAINNGTFSSTVDYTGLAAGTYTVSVKDTNGCRFDKSITLAENNGATSATITPTDANCNAADGSIAVSNITGGVAPYTTALNVGGFTNLPVGQYTVTITDDEGCVYTSSLIPINEKNQITAINASVTNVVCGSAFGQIAVNGVSGGIAPYTYKLNGTTKTPPFTGLALGTYIVSVEDANGCTYETQLVVGQDNSLTCAVSSDESDSEITTGESVVLTGEGTGTSGNWSPDVSDSTNASPSVSPAVTTTYIYTTSSAEGCESECPITIKVIPKIIPYTGFSPNSDGINDTWEIGYISKYPKAEVSVYTRWGQRVYHAKEGYGGAEIWDGTNHGLSLPVATFFYVIKLNIEDLEDESADEFHGTVTILK